MSKPKTPPLPGLPNSEAKRTRQARLAANFAFAMARFGPNTLSIGRAEQFTAARKDASATLQRARGEARARLAEGIEDAGIRRRFLAEQRELDRAIASFWRRFWCKVRPERKKGLPRQSKRGSIGVGRGPRLARGVALTSYSGLLVDRSGRVGVYLDARYHGARRSSVGIAGRMIKYITRYDGVEYDAAGDASVISNVGEDRDEQIAAFNLVETLNRASRDNAKIIITMIVNLPDDIDAAARLEILRRFCDEAFDLHDLPFVAAVHEPSEDGDQRNKHGHIVFSLRPLRRVGDHEWDAGQAVLTEFDNVERFAHYRKLFAQTMSDVVQEAGIRRTYTHLSNVDRGLKAKPLEKLGQARTAAVRRGEYVASHERNTAQVAINKRLVVEDRSSQRLARLAERISDLRGLRTRIASLTTIMPFRTAGDASAPVAIEAGSLRAVRIEPAERITVSPIAATPQSSKTIDTVAIDHMPPNALVHREPVKRSGPASAIEAPNAGTGTNVKAVVAKPVRAITIKPHPALELPVFSTAPRPSTSQNIEKVIAIAMPRPPASLPLNAMIDIEAIAERMRRRMKIANARHRRGAQGKVRGFGIDGGPTLD